MYISSDVGHDLCIEVGDGEKNAGYWFEPMDLSLATTYLAHLSEGTGIPSPSIPICLLFKTPSFYWSKPEKSPFNQTPCYKSKHHRNPHVLLGIFIPFSEFDLNIILEHLPRHPLEPMAKRHDTRDATRGPVPRQR